MPIYNMYSQVYKWNDVEHEVAQAHLSILLSRA